MELLDRAESTAESIDAAWCDGVSEDAGCAEELSGLMAIVAGLDAASSDVSDAVPCVSSLLECMDRCISAVLRSISVLSSSTADADGRVAALESLRGLSEAHQTEVNYEEVSAFGCVKELVSSLDVSSECEGCISGCMRCTRWVAGSACRRAALRRL